MLDAIAILNRIKKVYNLPTNVRLADFLDVTPQTISNWNKRNTIDYPKVIAKCMDCDMNFLLTGKRVQTAGSANAYPTNEDIVNIAADITAPYTTGNSTPIQIPLYELDSSTDLPAAFASFREQKTTYTISLPDLPLCQGALRIKGDSLLPSLHNGDIIAYKVENGSVKELIKGATYLLCCNIGGTEYTTITSLRKGTNTKYLHLVKPTPALPVKELLVTDIRILVRIEACVHYTIIK